ncbi:hypothetical protein NDU88_001244 [Pleurodeles waltl]|uniref:Uncharacterized protein n=1 Tax=Pleurodeles waltl TaxID=8319 RepID=A0AAV7V9U3_PLEWA|nr:hypothetical protein NDU88_001244 [Pleurodeles waltl]
MNGRAARALRHPGRHLLYDKTKADEGVWVRRQSCQCVRPVEKPTGTGGRAHAKGEPVPCRWQRPSTPQRDTDKQHGRRRPPPDRTAAVAGARRLSTTREEGTAGAERGPCGSQSPRHNAIPGGRSSSNGAGSLEGQARRQWREVRGVNRRGVPNGGGPSSPPASLPLPLSHNKVAAAAIRSDFTLRAGRPHGQSGAAGEGVCLDRTPGAAPLRGSAAQCSTTRQAKHRSSGGAIAEQAKTSRADSVSAHPGPAVIFMYQWGNSVHTARY